MLASSGGAYTKFHWEIPSFCVCWYFKYLVLCLENLPLLRWNCLRYCCLNQVIFQVSETVLQHGPPLSFSIVMQLVKILSSTSPGDLTGFLFFVSLVFEHLLKFLPSLCSITYTVFPGYFISLILGCI